MGLFKPNQILNKAYRQIAIETADFELFKNALRTLRDNVMDGQREETQKEHLRNFLSETFNNFAYNYGLIILFAFLNTDDVQQFGVESTV